MTRRWVVAAMAAVVGPSMGWGQWSRAADPSDANARAELTAHVERLRAQVTKLEEHNRAAEAANLAREVDQTVSAVLEDARARTPLLFQDAALTAGHAKGKFFMGSPDGNYLLNPSMQLQVRYVANYRDELPGDDDGALEDGFEIRRAKIAFDGNAVTPKLTYRLQLEVNRSGGAVLLEDAWVRYQLCPDWALRLGQFLEPVFHEQSVSSKRQLAVDRSMLNEFLGGNESYVQGASLIFAKGDLRGELIVHDGFKTRNTNFIDRQGGMLGIVPEFGLSGRIEYFLAGAPKAYDDFSAMGNSEDLLAIGGGFDYSAGGDNSGLWHTFDVQWEPQAAQGLGVYAAYVGLARDVESPDGVSAGPGAEDNPYDFGFVAQAGYMLSPKVEPFLRYDVMFLDDQATTFTGTEDTFQEITAGVNYFLSGHAAKFTVDASYLPDGAPSDITGIGVLAGPGEDQFVLRGQFQLLL